MITRLIVCCWLFAWQLQAQDQLAFNNVIAALKRSDAQSEKLWKALVSAGQIPLVHEDSVLFLYRGKASSVAWMGDFNAWGYDKKFNNKGARIATTDTWMLKASFPPDARLDYKILLDETTLILDPANPRQQWSGVGGGSPNSELRMPQWKADTLQQPRDHVLHGRIVKDVLITSLRLGYQVMYSVYLPPGYNASAQIRYPVLYVTDGYEYAHEQMGNLPTVLDNLIHLGKVRPVIAVLIDHREPVNRTNNRRMQELALNDRYRSFITEELIPAVEDQYHAGAQPKDRAILGSSMGGLTAAYFAFSKPDVFGLAGIQSPSFWFRPEIFTICDNPGNPPVKVFMTTGTMHDSQEGTLKMKEILDKNTCSYQYKAVNQGHSWGNWRALTGDILVYFFPPGE